MTFPADTAPIAVSVVPPQDAVSDAPPQAEDAGAAEGRAGFGRDITDTTWRSFCDYLSDWEKAELRREETGAARKWMGEFVLWTDYEAQLRHVQNRLSLRHYAQQITVPEPPAGLDRAAEGRWWNRMGRFREGAIRRMAQALAKGEPVRGSDVRSLFPDDIEEIRKHGDSHLREIVSAYEQAQIRRQDRGRDFGR